MRFLIFLAAFTPIYIGIFVTLGWRDAVLALLVIVCGLGCFVFMTCMIAWAVVWEPSNKSERVRK